MAITNISNLYTPAIWIRGLNELQLQRPSLINSPVVIRSEELNFAATGGGTSVNVPRFKPMRVLEEAQIESTAPTKNNVATATEVAPFLNRVVAIGTSSLAQAVSGERVVDYILENVADNRLLNFQLGLIYHLRGIFGNSSGVGALKNLRTDSFSEDGDNAGQDELIDSDIISDAIAKLDENVDKLVSGAFFVHPVIEAALNKQDVIDYVKPSESSLMLAFYKGIPLYRSNMLKRAGTGTGFVYETYIMAPGSLGLGLKPQSAIVGDASSLLLGEDEDKNDVTVYDRTRRIQHVAGTAWTGTPAGQSATNAELATETNWSFVGSHVENTGIIQIRTNG